MKLKQALEILKDGETLEQFDETEQVWSEVASWFISLAKKREFRIKVLPIEPDVEIAIGTDLDDIGARHGVFRFLSDHEFRIRIKQKLDGLRNE
jgi:hypothetical protein